MLRAIGTGGRGDSQAPPTINLGYTEGVEATWLHSERTEMDRLLVRAAGDLPRAWNRAEPGHGEAVFRRGNLPATQGERARGGRFCDPAHVHAGGSQHDGTAADDRCAQAELCTAHHGSVTLLWVR